MQSVVRICKLIHTIHWCYFHSPCKNYWKSRVGLKQSMPTHCSFTTTGRMLTIASFSSLLHSAFASISIHLLFLEVAISVEILLYIGNVCIFFLNNILICGEELHVIVWECLSLKWHLCHSFPSGECEISGPTMNLDSEEMKSPRQSLFKSNENPQSQGENLNGFIIKT